MTTTVQDFPIGGPELFAVLTNPDTYPEWLVGAKDIREISPDWPAPTSSFKHVVGFGPLAITDRTSVISVDGPRQLVLLVRARPAIEAKVTFTIEPTATGCTLRMKEDPVGVYKVISPVAQPLIRARNERSMSRLLGYVTNNVVGTSTASG